MSRASGPINIGTSMGLHAARHRTPGSQHHVTDFNYGQHLVAPRNEIGDVVKEKFVMLLDRFVLSAQNVGGDREDDNKAKLGSRIRWPYVMNSSLAMRGPLASGTWIWHHQHAHWHHGYYRTRS